MARLTDAAINHEPTGDPEHVAYGQDYRWTCDCGASSSFLAGADETRRRAERHEQYCPQDGTATVEVI